MKITSEIIQENLIRLESARKSFPILDQYFLETDDNKLRDYYAILRSYGLTNYATFIDYIKTVKRLNQQVFYSHKIKLKDFKECLIDCAPDPSVKKVLNSKGKASFAKLINSPKWELYSGNRNYTRRRGSFKYNDNFVASSAIIANFCIQNEIELEDTSRISSWYIQAIGHIDPSLIKEIELTSSVVNFIYNNMINEEFDFRKLNIENITKSIQSEIERKMTQIDQGESVKLSDATDYYSGLSNGKVYIVKGKSISNGRLNIKIENDLGFTREYPYRLFETVTNLRNAALDELLNDL